MTHNSRGCQVSHLQLLWMFRFAPRHCAGPTSKVWLANKVVLWRSLGWWLTQRCKCLGCTNWNLSPQLKYRMKSHVKHGDLQPSLMVLLATTALAQHFLHIVCVSPLIKIKWFILFLYLNWYIATPCWHFKWVKPFLQVHQYTHWIIDYHLVKKQYYLPLYLSGLRNQLPVFLLRNGNSSLSWRDCFWFKSL